MTSCANGKQQFRTGLIHQAGKKRRTSDGIPPFLGQYVPVLGPNTHQSHPKSLKRPEPPYWEQLGRQSLQLGQQSLRQFMAWKPRELLGIPLILIIIWVTVLWWGEEAVFKHRVEDCAWNRWETWPTTSEPHHVVLVADPQLVDPHTYPGRPWPLSSLTIRYTDLYMRKSFQQIQSILSPDSVFFLGDLFDGGREWSTYAGDRNERESPDKRWRGYDTRYWMKEYARFSRIFFEPWLQGEQPGRKIIAGLPGNHDLGLGSGIRIPVRQRFQAYFGNGNRFDIVGNHSFVSLDTVSLSAKGQPGQATSKQGINEEAHDRDVWEPVEQFLHTAKSERARAIDRELRVRDGKAENDALEHVALELDDPKAHTITLGNQMIGNIPSVILTHVPLYRAEGTPCGPLRERFPPSKSTDGEPLEKDDGNSIHVRHGLQYQNVLTPEISKEIVDLVGDVTHVFSGDDHDYCDVIHHGYTSKNGGIREITVKSISWAMGVRKPGVVLLSLWNPVATDGKAKVQEATKDITIETHLCLLPDQLSIFLRYGWLLIFTVFALLIRAGRTVYDRNIAKQAHRQLLPVSKSDSSDAMRQDTTAASARSPPTKRRLSVRSCAGRSRSLSPSNGYGYQPPAEEIESSLITGLAYEPSNGSVGNRGWNDITLDRTSKRKPARGLLAVYDEFRSSVVQVATPVLLFYGWLLINS